MTRSIVFAVRAWSPADAPAVYRIVEDGWLLGGFLRWFVQRCANGLAAHAARQTHPRSEAGHRA